MTALITIASVLAYLSCWTVSARWMYRRLRPWREPLSCSSRSACGRGDHYDSCYRRTGLIDTTGEAIVFSSLFGLLGPLAAGAVTAAWLIRYAVTTGAPDLREELEAKIKRLEVEKVNWENDHDH